MKSSIADDNQTLEDGVKLQRPDWKRAFKLTDPDVALRTTLYHLEPGGAGVETVLVERSMRRILAEDIASPMDIPPSHTAAMDGYAIRSTDTSNASELHGVRLRVVGRIMKGDERRPALREGEAVYVAMGCPLPKGADAVARLERAKLLDDEIEIRLPIPLWKDVLRAGEDIERGSVVLSKGRILSPHDVGTLLGLRRRVVRVVRRPRAAIVSVGDELIGIDSPAAGRTVNNYAYIVSGLVSELDAIPILLGIAPAKLQAIKDKVGEALGIADIVLTIGGCSVGVKDLVPDAVNASGSPGILVHGLKVNGFRAAGLGVVNGKPLVMLPASAVSAVGAFCVLAVPILNTLCGLKPGARPPVVEARLTKGVSRKPGVNNFFLVSMKRGEDGFLAEPLRYGTNLLSNLVQARGFIFVREGEELSEGGRVKVRLFSASELLRLA